jgi:hypothetical protein
MAAHEFWFVLSLAPGEFMKTSGHCGIARAAQTKMGALPTGKEEKNRLDVSRQGKNALRGEVKRFCPIRVF